MVETLLTEDEMNELSDETQFARPGICTILRRTEGRDPTGGVTVTYSSVGTTHCRLELPNRVFTEYQVAGRPSPVVPYWIFTDRQSQISSDDLIELDGERYEIHGVAGAETFTAEKRLQVVLISDLPT